jgi:hypothetical protein
MTTWQCVFFSIFFGGGPVMFVATHFLSLISAKVFLGSEASAQASGNLKIIAHEKTKRGNIVYYCAPLRFSKINLC